jgi:hypothetical protein
MKDVLKVFLEAGKNQSLPLLIRLRSIKEMFFVKLLDHFHKCKRIEG